MKLTRYVIENNEGVAEGLARFVDFDVDHELEAAICEEEEHLVIPEPYPDNSHSYFTEARAERHKHLIDLWVKNVTLQNFVVKKRIVEFDGFASAVVLYQDEAQIILSGTLDLPVLNETIVDISNHLIQMYKFCEEDGSYSASQGFGNEYETAGYYLHTKEPFVFHKEMEDEVEFWEAVYGLLKRCKAAGTENAI